MKILTRLILSEFSSHLLFGFFLFTFILLLDRLFEIADLLFNKGVGVLKILHLIGLLIPTLVSLTVPMACLLAALLTFGRLSEDNELTALRSGGISLVAMGWPLFVFAVSVTIGLILFNAEVAPVAHAGVRHLMWEIAQHNPLLSLEKQTFLPMGEYRLYAEQIDRKTRHLEGVTIYKLTPQEPPLRIFAKEGTITVTTAGDIQMALTDGSLHRFNPSDPVRLSETKFTTYTLSIPLGMREIRHLPRGLRQLKSCELSAQLREAVHAHQPTQHLRTELHLRNVVAVTPFIFIMLGIGLGLKVERGSRAMGFGISLLVVLGYYLLLITGITFSERGISPPPIALWAPNLISLGLAVLLMWRVAKR
ncbi:MAG: LptF/LptG family permease [Elusimicrobia bacterium]|nr:LptF/LptG family permease [Elusimicrobiota bacterium]